MKKNESTLAPAGQIWVCGACGKTATDRYAFKDVSCMLNSVLCYEDSLEYENGRVVKADAAGGVDGKRQEK